MSNFQAKKDDVQLALGPAPKPSGQAYSVEMKTRGKQRGQGYTFHEIQTKC